MNGVIFSVSEINEHIKELLDTDPWMSSVYVRGEISNYKLYPSGHHYFTLKDPEGALRCVMFKGSASKLRFRPENGMKVIAFGRISVYPRDGAYQMYINELTPDGVGDLHMAFEQLKEKLFKEGLFDSAHKKPIPRYPEKIAVITSSAGAAVRDIITVLSKRWPAAKVIVLPVRVQGVEAPPEITGAIKYANKYKVADVIITGRGGGSIEDLWAFNDERVARAIFDSDIPVISAVGHEPDVTIADFVADVRAATPSNAAELAVPDQLEFRDSLTSYEIRMTNALGREIKAMRRRVEELSAKRVMQAPGMYIDDKRLLIDRIQERLVSAVERKQFSGRERYVYLASTLDALSPLKVLGRGYSIARGEGGKIIKKAADVKKGDRVKIRLKADEISCVVE